MTAFKDSDLENLLMFGSSGAFDHFGWSVFEDNDSSSVHSRLTSQHEYQHDELNQTTSYGLLLTVIAYLARELDSEEYLTKLKILVNKCRTTHEIRATFLSTLIVSESPDFNDEPSTLLEGNIKYLDYFNQGNSLVRGLPNAYLKSIGVMTITSLCFQNPAIIEIACRSLELFDPNEISIKDSPDRRLSFLSRYINKEFWKRIIDALKNDIEDTDLKLFEPDFNESNNYSISGERIDSIGILFQEKLDLELQQIFAQEDMAFITNDGHLELLNELLEKAHEIVPAEKAKIPLRAYKSGDPNSDILLSFEKEAVTYSNQGIKCRFYELKKIAQSDWDKLSMGTGETEHIYVFSRPGDCLFRNYSPTNLTDEEVKFLSSLPLTCIVKNVYEDDELVVELFYIHDVDQFEEFKNLLEGIPIYVSTSMLVFSFKPWALAWEKSLNSCHFNTFLFDLKPSIQIGRLKELFTEFSFEKYNLDGLEKERTIVVFCGILKGGLKSFWFAPSTEMKANLMTYYMASNYPEISNKLNLSEEEKLKFQYLFGNLMTSERFFKFDALDSQLGKIIVDYDATGNI